MKAYFLNVLIAIDSLGNAITGGLPGQTISARAAMARDRHQFWGCVLCKFLDSLQANHCDNALKGDAERADAVESAIGAEE